LRLLVLVSLQLTDGGLECSHYSSLRAVRNVGTTAF
jgi:hypothetical protein